MATYGWRTKYSVEQWLFDEGYRFDFYQAVRLLEQIYPEKRQVGDPGDPATEVVRFRSNVSMAFPASEVADVQPAANGRPAEMVVNFFGLAGALAPLPVPYTEMVLHRIWKKDTALRDFLDIFNHRLISLMYRVRRLHRIGLEVRSPDQNHLAPFLYSFIGLETAGLKGRMQIPDRALLYYAGILAERPHSMAGLLTILRDYFALPFRARQMVGRWLRLDYDDRTAIGRRGRQHVLGNDAALGGRVWDQQGRFELELGPLTYERLLDFIPTGRAFAALCSLVWFYAGDEHEFGLQLTVERPTIPPLRLGTDRGARLGWTSWLQVERKDDGIRTVRITPRRIADERNRRRSDRWNLN